MPSSIIDTDGDGSTVPEAFIDAGGSVISASEPGEPTVNRTIVREEIVLEEEALGGTFVRVNF